MTRGFALAALLALLTSGALAAQTPPAATFLPQDHWVHDVVRRVAAEGPGGAVAAPAVAVSGRRTLTRAEALAVLDAAADAGSVAAIAARQRFLAEFPLEELPGGGSAAVHLAGAVGFDRHVGDLLAGTGYGRDGIPSEPPTPAEDILGPVAGLHFSGRMGSRVAVTAEGGYGADAWEVQSAHVVVALGPTLLWAGRRPVGYGPGEGGGVVLGDAVRVDGGGLQLRAPLQGSGIFRWLGPIHFEALLSRMDSNGPVDDPLFMAMRGSIQPHRRVSLGVSRGAFFGGEGQDMSLRDVLYLLIGKHGPQGSSGENQIVAVDLSYQAPLPVPVEAYIEWGFEDSAGAWRAVPGILWGIAASGAWPGSRLGLEHTSFAESCCGNPIWYRHMYLAEGWTADGAPLGHPLGGHGEELLLFARQAFLEERLQLGASLAWRDRDHENLFAPDREGRSRAGALTLNYLASRWRIVTELRTEQGAEWSETLIRTSVRLWP